MVKLDDKILNETEQRGLISVHVFRLPGSYLRSTEIHYALCRTIKRENQGLVYRNVRIPVFN